MIHNNFDFHTVYTAAIGRWPEILHSLAAIPLPYLDGKGHPCVNCGEGNDRFNTGADFKTKGTCFCRRCKLGGDGFNVLKKLKGWDRRTAINEVGKFLQLHGRPNESVPQTLEKKNNRGQTLERAIAAQRGFVAAGLPPQVELSRECLRYIYHDAMGDEVGAVLRWDRSDGQKEIRPLFKDATGWKLKSIPKPRPVYRLAEVITSKTVVITEGEKAAEALVSRGICTTTSAGGSNAAKATDWSTLSGKQIIIVPDNDDAGRRYAEDVTRLIMESADGVTVSIAELPDLWPEAAEKDDAADWVTAHPNQSDGWFFEQLLTNAQLVVHAAHGESIVATDFSSDIHEFHEFPIHCLPGSLAAFVDETARSLGVDSAFVALPVLAGCAAAIGRSRQLKVKEGWLVPSVLWMAVIGESGSGKSPAFRAAMEPFGRWQSEQLRDFMAASEEHEQAMELFRRDRKQFQRREDGDPPIAPREPRRQQLVVKDTTIEGLGVVLAENPRGLLLSRDELSNWIASFERYARGSSVSADATSWIEFYNCETIVINRKSRESQMVSIDSPAVSICGGIQPKILKQVMTEEFIANGLFARLMLAYPPRGKRQWQTTEVSEETRTTYHSVVQKLLQLQPLQRDEVEFVPETMTLSDSAQSLMIDFINQNGEEQSVMPSEFASQWSKVEELPLRLAIVLHCVQQIADQVSNPLTVDSATVEAAIKLSEWFKSESLRVAALLSEDDSIKEDRILCKLIKRRGGTITANQLRQARRDIHTGEQAEQLLIRLVERGWGCWQPLRKSRQFVLSERLRLLPETKA